MSQEQLRRAYTLIQGERLDEATEIIRRVLSSDPDNADAWWLLANAVTEPADAAEALGNVLRLNPGHAEARAAYDELIAEYPDLAADTSDYGDAYESSFDEGYDSPNAFDALAGYDSPTLYGEKTEFNLTAAPPSSATMASFAEESLDNPALDDLFGGANDIDGLLSQTPTGVPQTRAAATDTSLDWMQPSGTPANINDIDLDSMFGGAQMMNIPATATEDRDLDEMFFGEQPPAPPTPPKDEPLEGILDSFEATVPTKAIRDRRETGSVPSQAAPDADMELDALFSDPGFVKDLDKEEGKGRRGRRRRKEQAQAAQYFQEPEPEPTPAPKVEPAKKTRTQERPVRVSAPQQFDPYRGELRVNRRNPFFTLVSFLVVAAIVAAAAFLIPRFLQPDPMALAVQIAQANLTSAGFTAVSAEGTGNIFRVTVCSTPGRALQGRVYEAMDTVADSIGQAASTVQSAQIVVTDCADTNRVLFRASAPISAITSYLQGQKRDVRGYRAAWR